MDSRQATQARFSEMIQRSRLDFFSPAMIALNILPTLFGVVLWGGVLYGFSDTIIACATGLLPESFQTYVRTGSGIIASSIVVSLYVLLGLCVVLLVFVGNVFVSIFYTPLVVSYIRKRHYPQYPKLPSVSIAQSLKHCFKAFALLCVLCMICVPLLFVPVVGGAIMLVPFFVFFYQTMLFDVGQEVLGRDGYIAVHKAPYKYIITPLVYLLGLVPILNFFTPLLQVIMLSHYCFWILMESKQEINIAP